MRTYLFVDAESHYRRSLVIAEKIIGSSRAHQIFPIIDFSHWQGSAFPNHIESRRFGWKDHLQLFWDCTVYHSLADGNYGTPDRAIYVCSCAGSDDDIHNMRVEIRNLGFEPIVVREPKDHYKRRAADLASHQIIEKPKGCDIALATRMVSDAAADLYDACCLFTSDIDFLPAVEAARRMGKVVTVAGYRSALGKRSPYLYVPDRFIDLEAMIERAWVERQPDIIKELRARGETGLLNAKPEFSTL